MSTVFSHIVQKHLSQSYENVSTDALSFILSSSDGARRGLMRLLRSLVPELPDLQFRTQLSKGSSRPDMWGMEGNRSRVFLENKFWAGLTENQPVSYLKILAESDPSGILLFVAPAAREDFLWRELGNRLRESNIDAVAIKDTAGVSFAAKTGSGPVIALTSWDRLIAIIELEIANDKEDLANVHQLRALCKAADGDAFIRFSREEISNQRMPSIVLQAGTIVQKASARATSDGIIRTEKLLPSANWDRIGRYLKFSCVNGHVGGFGAFFGVDFDLWQRLGETPLWVTFSISSDHGDWKRATDVRAVFEPESAKHNIFTTMETDRFAIAINVPTGEEMGVIVKSVVEQLGFISRILAQAPPTLETSPSQTSSPSASAETPVAGTRQA